VQETLMGPPKTPQRSGFSSGRETRALRVNKRLEGLFYFQSLLKVFPLNRILERRSLIAKLNSVMC